MASKETVGFAFEPHGQIIQAKRVQSFEGTSPIRGTRKNNFVAICDPG